MVEKSDAMLQHEKWIAWVMTHNPKALPGTDMAINLLPETQMLIIAFAVIAVLVGIALSVHL